MVKGKVFFLIGSVGVILFVACSSKNTPGNKVVEDTACVYGEENITSESVQQPTISLDSLRVNSISNTQHSNHSGLDISVNPYYDEGFEQGQEDGYNDGIENLRGDSYDDSNRYKGKKRKEYELGYEEGYDTGFDDVFADSDYDSEDEE